MNRIAGWRWWLASVLTGRRHWTGYAPVHVPAGTPRWKRFWYRVKPPPPPPHRPVPRQPWMGPPEDEMGVGLTMQRRVSAGPEAVVILTGCVAFTAGFSLCLGIRRKEEPEWVRNPPMRGRPPGRLSDEMSLDLAVRFSDGREASMSGRGLSSPVLDWYRAWHDGENPPTPPGPIIGPSSGGGGGKRWDMNYWIYPLPPDGPMTITCKWPAGGVPDAVVEVDGSAIRRAGLSSEKLWMEE